MKNIGKIAFILGLVIAVIGAFGITQSWFAWVLAILGVIVGLLNVSAEEARGFLIAGIALLLSATALNGIPYLGGYITTIMSNLTIFLAAAIFVVAIISVFHSARE